VGPPGIKDLTHRWVKLCCEGAGLEWETALASFDRVQLAPMGVVTRLHTESGSAHAWCSQIQGVRAFVLFSPLERSKLYPEAHQPEGSWGSRCEHSPIDVLQPNAKMYPRFKDSQAQVAVIAPGETLVIPQGWWHFSVTLEPSVTLHRRFWNRVNRSAIHDEFPSLLGVAELQPGLREAFLCHVEGCRRDIELDDTSDEDDKP